MTDMLSKWWVNDFGSGTVTLIFKSTWRHVRKWWLDSHDPSLTSAWHQPETPSEVPVTSGLTQTLFPCPSLYDSSKQHLEITIKAKSVFNNWKRPKPHASRRTSPDKRGHVNRLFVWMCDRAPEVSVQVCCSSPTPQFCFLPLSWSRGISFLVSQAGQRLVSQRGTDITLQKKVMMGKPMKNSWHTAILRSCWGPLNALQTKWLALCWSDV